MKLPGRLTALPLLLLSCLVVVPVAAQTLGSRPALLGGVETRSYRFADALTVRRIQQLAVPLGAAATRGRLSLDIGAHWAATTFTRPDRRFRRVTGLTDTQLRVGYTLGRDAAVASLVVNLPTGRDRMSPQDFDVLGTVSSSFLAYPVNTYANGGSVTAALAGVASRGAWNIGLAGSVRANQRFTPVVDPVAGPLTYRAGVEGRLRVGVDRLVGASRLAAGLTLSGFRDDSYSGFGGVRGRYQPGQRWIAEMMVVSPFLGGLATTNLWGYFRSAGDTAGVSVENAERLVGASITGSWVLSPALDLEPVIELRRAALESGTGFLAGGGIGLRGRVHRRASVAGAVKWEAGFLDLVTRGDGGEVDVRRTGLQSLSLSAFLRWSL